MCAAEDGWSSGVRRLGPSVVEGLWIGSSSMSFGTWGDKSEGEVGMRREWKRNIVFRRTEISGSTEISQCQRNEVRVHEVHSTLESFA